ncbi:MAG: hypothetical protein ACXAEI_07315 [Candidatus Hodarchaeales archaeon]
MVGIRILKSRPGLEPLIEPSEDYQEYNKIQDPFAIKEYLDPSPIPQRPDRWYNGSLMGVCGKDPFLFGPKGRLRALHSKITSQETPGSQPRAQYYRLIGNLLSQFFSFTILDPLIEELIGSDKIRLPRAIDKAISMVLACVEMHLRKNNRMILKESIIAEIAEELGVDITRQKISAAKWLLAKCGFWEDYLHEINMATYEVLRNLTLDIIASFPFPVQDNMMSFRRQLHQQSLILVENLAETRRRPQALEIYAHVIVSIAAEKLLNTPVVTAEMLGDPQFTKRFHRAKRQFMDMLGIFPKN